MAGSQAARPAGLPWAVGAEFRIQADRSWDCVVSVSHIAACGRNHPPSYRPVDGGQGPNAAPASVLRDWTGDQLQAGAQRCQRRPARRSAASRRRP